MSSPATRERTVISFPFSNPCNVSRKLIEDLKEILPTLGIDPDLAEFGFQAPDPFIIAVLLAALFRLRVVPSRILTKVPCPKGWPELASWDPAMLVKWLEKFGYQNWSILTGRANGIVILDWDGQKGREDRIRLEAELGPLTPTWRCDSGRADGGYHLWYALPRGIDEPRNQQGTKGFKLDVRGWHGHAVLAGSKHKSGTRYKWHPGCAPDEMGMAELPHSWWDWLPKKGEVSRIRSRARPNGPRSSTGKAEHNQHSAVIGDGPGEGGFNRPIRVLCCQFFSRYGIDADPYQFKELLKEEIRKADASGHTPDQVERYASDEYLTAELISARNYIAQVSRHG